MSAAQPWFKFHPLDWRADEKLRLCSLAARGLWIEMLAIMHRSERYGHLLIAGSVPTDAQLAVQVGASSAEVTALLADLAAADVFSKTASGAIYSRRMTRDHKKAKEARKNGKAGGNPTLCKKTDNSASDKGQDNRPLKLRDQKTDKKPIGKKETALPDGWKPEPFGEGKCKAIIDRWTAEQLSTQVEKFAAHHRTRGNRWADWQSAWQTWVLNSVQFTQSRHSPAEQKPLYQIIAERTALDRMGASA